MSVITKIVIILSLLIVVTVSVHLYRARSTPTAAELSSSLGITSSTNINTSTNSVIDLKTRTGQTVPVRDFKADSDVKTWYDQSTYLIGNGKQNDSDAYQIFYFENDQSVNISLLSEPLSSIRLIAEDQLTKRLGLSPAVLCTLNIHVGTPSFVSEQYSGSNLGLSFCPGNVTLP